MTGKTWSYSIFGVQYDICVRKSGLFTRIDPELHFLLFPTFPATSFAILLDPDKCHRYRHHFYSGIADRNYGYEKG